MSDSDGPAPKRRRRRHVWQSKPAQAAKVREEGAALLPRMRRRST